MYLFTRMQVRGVSMGVLILRLTKSTWVRRFPAALLVRRLPIGWALIRTT
jgi:hypothetical protein